MEIKHTFLLTFIVNQAAVPSSHLEKSVLLGMLGPQEANSELSPYSDAMYKER